MGDEGDERDDVEALKPTPLPGPWNRGGRPDEGCIGGAGEGGLRWNRGGIVDSGWCCCRAWKRGGKLPLLGM